MNTVIEPMEKVGRCSRIASSTTGGSKRYASTSGIGTSRAIARCPMTPVMWNSGATPSTESLGPSWIQSR